MHACWPAKMLRFTESQTYPGMPVVLLHNLRVSLLRSRPKASCILNKSL